MRALLACVVPLGLLACASAPPATPPAAAVLAPASSAPVAAASVAAGSVAAASSAGAPAMGPPPASAAPMVAGEPAPPVSDVRPGKGEAWSDVLLRQGPTQVTGRLPPEVIQRIVRQQYGRFRQCAQQAPPRAMLRVMAQFTIDEAGHIGRDTTVTTEPEEAAMNACITHRLAGVSFPQPEGGTVAVVYPLAISREIVPKAAAARPNKSGAAGGAWGSSIGEAFGAGGLGLTGVGQGGGGKGEGIGLGTPDANARPK